MNRLALILLLTAAALVSSHASAKGVRPQPGPPITLLGPDGMAEAALRRAWLAPWRARHGKLAYVPAGTGMQAVRSLAALREHAAADLVLLEAYAAEQALARGLVLPVRIEAVASPQALVPQALAVGGPCVPVGFDALAVRTRPEGTARTAEPAGLAALVAAPLAERLALPAPGELLGALLVGLLAQESAGDWRAVGAGLARLDQLRGGAPAGRPLPSPVTEVVWNGAAQAEADAAPGAARLSIPHEATMLRPLVLCLSASARQPRAASEFIAFALGDGAQAALARALYLAPVHAGIDLPGPVRARVPSLAPAARPALADAAFRADLRAALARQDARLAMAGDGSRN